MGKGIGYRKVSAVDAAGKTYDTNDINALLRAMCPERMDEFKALFPSMKSNCLVYRLYALGITGYAAPSAADRNGREYSVEDMRLVFQKLYPKKADAIALMFPGLTARAIKGRAAYYGIIETSRRGKRESWTITELQVLREKAPDYRAIRKSLPHRTLTAIAAKCRKLGLQSTNQGHFTSKEDDMIRRGIVPPGRTRESAAIRMGRLGLNANTIRSVVSTPAEELLRRISYCVPCGYPEDRRQDAIYTVYQECMEGRCSAEMDDLKKAARKAVTATYKLHPDRGAPVSMDAKLFDDGSATVGDRISSDTFHF
ncbi:hypothetical protein [Methylobacterium sp. CM6244]